jgi:hypothetical protein
VFSWPLKTVRQSWLFGGEEEDWVDEECDQAELLDIMWDRDGTKMRGDAEEDYFVEAEEDYMPD